MKQQLGEILVGAGVLTAESFGVALEEQKRRGGNIARILLDLKFVDERVLVQALSQQFHVPAIDLDEIDVDADVYSCVSADFAERNGVVPFRKQGAFLDIAMMDPMNIDVAEELRIRTQLNVRTFVAGPNMISRAIGRFYGRGFSAPRFEMRDFEESDGSEIRSLNPIEDTTPVSHQEYMELKMRVDALESLVGRDEDVIKRILGMLVDQGVITREELLEKLK